MNVRVTNSNRLSAIVGRPVERVEYLDDGGIPWLVEIRYTGQAAPLPEPRAAGRGSIRNRRGPFGGTNVVAAAVADKDA